MVTALVHVCLAVAALMAAGVGGQQVDLFAAIAVPRMSQEEFRLLHAEGAVLVLDVRSDPAYRSGHIPGARHLPLASARVEAELIRELAGARPVVTYCACPTEHASAEAARILMRHGVGRVSALVGGFDGWVRAGGRVERGKLVSELAN